MLQYKYQESGSLDYSLLKRSTKMGNTTYVCADCKHEFQAPKLISKSKDGVKFYSTDKLKQSDIQDVVQYGVFLPRKVVIVCPKCQCFHS
jgi:DNA-directed RNA polymerase subunit M/transcription elongation factor TFIIS